MEQVLVFRLGDELFGLDIDNVQEIVETEEFHYIPRVPDLFLGAVSLHGSILPVLDLGRYLDLPGGEHDHRVIALRTDLCSLALAVTAVDRIRPLPAEGLLPLPEERAGAAHLKGLVGFGPDLVTILDPSGLLRDLEGKLKATGGTHGA